MGLRGKSNRYLGAHNPSTITGVGQDAYGTWWPPKKTVAEAGKGLRIPRRLLAAARGDIWPNPDSVLAALEVKCFTEPKMFGG